METKDIRHKAEIIRVEGRRVVVSFLSQGGCGSCKARGKCGMVESDRREVEVLVPRGETYNIGESVMLSVTMGMGRMAVILAYVVPLVLLLVLMIVGVVLNFAEWGVALAGLVGVALYFYALYLAKDKIEKKINFTITK